MPGTSREINAAFVHMASLFGDGIVGRLLKEQVEQERLSGNVWDRALAYVRSLYPDAQGHELYNTPSAYLYAQEQGRCIETCTGATGCPQCGYIPQVLCRDENGHRLFVVSSLLCAELRRESSQRQILALARDSRVPERMRVCTFENYNTSPPLDPPLAAAKGIAMACANDGNSLVLGGGTGTGKTHLAIAITQAVIAQGKYALFVPVIEMLSRMRPGEGNGQDETMSALRKADCVVLDDLGAEKSSDWVGERLFEIIDYRYRNGSQTVITTNAVSMKELQDMIGDRGVRIVSRLAEIAYPVFIKGKDYRQRRIQKRLMQGVM